MVCIMSHILEQNMLKEIVMCEVMDYMDSGTGQFANMAKSQWKKTLVSATPNQLKLVKAEKCI